MKWLSNFFKKFWSMFRSGLDKFLSDNIEEAMGIVFNAWKAAGSPLNLKAFKDEVFADMSDYYKQSRGTWVSILIDLAWDALKNSGKV
jgi:hypothetical protein